MLRLLSEFGRLKGFLYHLRLFQAYYRHANASHADEIDRDDWTSYCSVCDVRLPSLPGLIKEILLAIDSHSQQFLPIILIIYFVTRKLLTSCVIATLYLIWLHLLTGTLEKHTFVAHLKAERSLAEQIQCNYCPNTFARHRFVLFRCQLEFIVSFLLFFF